MNNMYVVKYPMRCLTIKNKTRCKTLIVILVEIYYYLHDLMEYVEGIMRGQP